MSLAGSISIPGAMATGALQSASETGSKETKLETEKDKLILSTFVNLSKQGWRLAPKGKGSPTGEGIHLRGVGLMIPPREEVSWADELRKKRIDYLQHQMDQPTKKNVSAIKVLKNGKVYHALMDRDTQAVHVTNEEAPTPSSEENIYMHDPTMGDWTPVPMSKVPEFLKRDWKFGRTKTERYPSHGERMMPSKVAMAVADRQLASPDKRLTPYDLRNFNTMGASERTAVPFKIIEHEFERTGAVDKILKGVGLEGRKVYVYELRVGDTKMGPLEAAKLLEHVYGMSPTDAMALAVTKFGKIRAEDVKGLGPPPKPATGSKGVYPWPAYQEALKLKSKAEVDAEITALGWIVPEAPQE